MSIFIVQHLVTLAEATRIMRLFKQKRHAGCGYFFELQDLGATMREATKLSGLQPYGDDPARTTRSFWWREGAYLLRVFRDVPPKPGA